MKTRKFSLKKTALSIIVLILLVGLIFIGAYKFETSSVSNDNKSIIIKIDKGDNLYNIASKLKQKDLIKSEFFYKLFLKLHKPGQISAGEYSLNKSMDVSKIVNTLEDEGNIIDTSIKLTFREGLNVMQMAKIIEDKTGISKDEFLAKISDETYIDSLIDKYWFLTNEIKNPNIYYDLEGYLYPDTYIVEKEDLNLDKIISKILNNTDKKFTEIKSDIDSSSYTLHQILTLASLVELEATTDKDRALVAGVFYNRLKNNWTLGSDVTTYYASKKLMTESLTKEELSACNGYNTRCSTMKGLPVGPIDNPSISAIKATIHPETSDYYYFVADNSKKVYFTKTLNEHQNIIAKLKKEGKWIG